MKELTIREVSINNHLIVFTTEDMEERLWNPFQQDENYVPHEIHVEYNCLDGREFNLLRSLIRKYAPDATSLEDGVNSVAAIGINENKAIDAYWSKEMKKWFFRY